MSLEGNRQPIRLWRRSLLHDYTEMILHSFCVSPPIMKRFVANKHNWPVGYSDSDFWCRPITKAGFEFPEPFRVFWADGDPDYDPDDPNACDAQNERIEIWLMHLGCYDAELL